MEIVKSGQKIIFILLGATLVLSACHSKKTAIPAGHFETVAIDQTKTLFPLAHYPQSLDRWIPTAGSSGNKLLMDNSAQNQYFSALLSRFFGLGDDGRSPWNKKYVKRILKNNPENNIHNSIKVFLSASSHSWAENFRENTPRWKTSIKNNIPNHLNVDYRPQSRAITLRETLVRVLPTIEPAFHDPRWAGEGYPFDNLQMSSLKPATPVYRLGESLDKVWVYIVSPSVMGWVKSEDIAEVTEDFISRWSAQAHKSIGTFIREQIPISDNNSVTMNSRIGVLLPFTSLKQGQYHAWIPVLGAKGIAEIKTVKINQDVFVAMPWVMNIKHMAYLIDEMIGKPYGWGNTLFYNDCSAEMRTLLMPFGILLPRNSAAQINAATKIVDLSKLTVTERLDYLTRYGKPFTTLIYIPGHIMLYIGNGEFNGEIVPLTYQNIWGLRSAGKQTRSIIGGSAILPLLSIYAEDPNLLSLASKPSFKLGYLTEN